MIRTAVEKTRTRQSHVIPDFYLKKFANGGKLYAYTRQRPVRAVIVKPKGRVKECRERDYFEYPIDEKWSANKVENWLASIEDQASSVYSAIQNNQTLEPEEAGIWAVFVAPLFLRTRKVRLQLGPTALQTLIPTDDSDIRTYQYELLK